MSPTCIQIARDAKPLVAGDFCIPRTQRGRQNRRSRGDLVRRPSTAARNRLASRVSRLAGSVSVVSLEVQVWANGRTGALWVVNFRFTRPLRPEVFVNRVCKNRFTPKRGFGPPAQKPRLGVNRFLHTRFTKTSGRKGLVNRKFTTHNAPVLPFAPTYPSSETMETETRQAGRSATSPCRKGFLVVDDKFRYSRRDDEKSPIFNFFENRLFVDFDICRNLGRW